MSGTVNTDIYRLGATQPTTDALSSGNPFAMMQSMAETQSLNIANQQNKLMLQARQAMGPLAQQSVDPRTGQMDYEKFALLISTNPSTAFMAPQIIDQLTQRQLVQAQTINSKLEGAIKRFDILGRVGNSLIAHGPNITVDDMVQGIAQAQAAGGIDHEHAIQMVSMVQGKSGPELYDMARRFTLSGMGAKEAAETVYGKIELQNQGGGVSAVQSSPFLGTSTQLSMGGPGTAGGILPMSPTPEQRNALVPGVGNRGEITQTPRFAVAPMVNGAGQAAPGAGAGQAAPLPTTGTTSPPEDVMQYYKGQGNGAKYMDELNHQVESANLARLNYKEQMGMLYGDDGKPKIFTGAGAGVFNAIANTARTMGFPDKTVSAISGGDMSAAMSFEKLVISNVFNQLANSVGKGRIAVSEFNETLQHGTPNLSMTPEAISTITKYLDFLASLSQKEQSWAQAKIQDAEAQGWHNVKYTPSQLPAQWTQLMTKAGLFDKIKAMDHEAAQALKGNMQK